MEEPSSTRNSISFQSIRFEDLSDFTEIGKGGFGTVYKAKDKIMGTVAVKECSLNSQTEVDGLAKPGSNQFIVQIFGWKKKNDNSYIVMEYMEYGSLKEFSKKLKLPDSLKIKMISEVIKGMHFLHNKEILHRDLKLDNIFVGREFSVKIGDLGLATWKSVKDRSKSTPGTVTHMAPEILKSIDEPASKESDVYSFGITLWELSTCQDPYKNAQNIALLKVHVLQCTRPDMKCFPKNEPQLIKDMMERAWHQTPAERPTFQELKKEIEKEYEDNYENDIKSDISKVYDDLLAKRKVPEGPCTAPRSGDVTDSSLKLPEDDVSIQQGAMPCPLRSIDQPRNGSIPEKESVTKKSVTVLDTEKGQIQGVSRAIANLCLDEERKAVQPESGATEEFKSMGGKAVQPESDATEGSGFTPGPATEEFTPRTPTQETSKTSSWNNQPQNQQQTGYYPPQNHPFMPQNPWSQGGNINISGDGHTVILAGPGSTVTMPEPKKGEKRTGRRDNSSASKGGSHTGSTDTTHRQKGKKMGGRQDSPSSSDSESDVLDPEVLEIMKSIGILEEKHISKLSGHIGRKWKELGQELRLKTSKIENIEYDNHRDQREMAFQVMLAWMRKKGKATKGELATALVDVGLSEVALKLK